MTEEERKQLEDMRDYIQYSLENDCRFGLVLSTLGHDAGGILLKDPCFSPRSADYSEHLVKSRERKAEMKEKVRGG